ncbi:hypothetical protein BC827DRAFT_482396 [Russula dissimulans]|nr:hypothetical protein BC827DRAFT_482396 [Russula dissimulans]
MSAPPAHTNSDRRPLPYQFLNRRRAWYYVWSSSNPPRASWEHPFGPLRPPSSSPPSPPSDRTTNPGGGASGGAGGAGASGSGAGGGGSPHNPPQAAVTPYAGSQQRQPLLVTNEHPVHAPGSRAYSPISSFQSQLNYGQPSANSGNPNWPPLNGLCHRIMTQSRTVPSQHAVDETTGFWDWEMI